MKLKVLLPVTILVDEMVDKVIAEGMQGSFCILPRHLDVVIGLVPGLLSFSRGTSDEYCALDHGVLVKQDDTVYVSSRHGVRHVELGELQKTLEHEFLKIDEQEQKVRRAFKKLEADFIRRFLKMEDYG